MILTIKSIKVIFIFLLTLSFYGWGQKTIVCTTEDLAHLTKVIVGETVLVSYLASGKTDPHQVELKPSFALKLSKADVVIRNGVSLDDWIFPLIANSRNYKLTRGKDSHIDASKGVQLIGKDLKVDRSMGDVHADGNPHYLLNPSNVIDLVKYLCQSLNKVFPKHTQTFKANKDNFITTLQSKIIKWSESMQTIKNKQVVVYHKNWQYFCDFFDLQVANAIEPKPGVPPTIRHVKHLIVQMKAEKINIIIQAPYFEKRTPAHIAGKTEAKVYILAHQVGVFKKVDTYIKMMDYNVDQLTKF